MMSLFLLNVVISLFFLNCCKRLLYDDNLFLYNSKLGLWSQPADNLAQLADGFGRLIPLTEADIGGLNRYKVIK